MQWLSFCDVVYRGKEREVGERSGMCVTWRVWGEGGGDRGRGLVSV